MSCSAPSTGGRRRSRKMRGGMGYGMSGTIGTAGAVYAPSWGGEVTKAGAPVYDTADPQRGSSRRRKSRRGGADDDMVDVIASKSEMPEDVARAAGAIETMSRKEAEEKGYKILGPASRPSVARTVSSHGARRRKSSKKSKKTGRKSRRKTMRGGAQWQSVGAVGAGFKGEGSRGLADYSAYASKVPPAGGPGQNPDGAFRP